MKPCRPMPAGAELSPREVRVRRPRSGLKRVRHWSSWATQPVPKEETARPLGEHRNAYCANRRNLSAFFPSQREVVGAALSRSASTSRMVPPVEAYSVMSRTTAFAACSLMILMACCADAFLV